MGVLNHLNLPFAIADLPTCLLPLAICHLLLAICYLPSRAWAAWGPDFDGVARSSRQTFLLAASWAIFSDFLSLQRGIKILRFFSIAPKGQKSHNQWPKVAPGLIFGQIFTDLGCHFSIGFSTCWGIDSASNFH